MGPLQVGDRFEKFQILGLLGRGGHAFVYHGYQEFLDRHVAIKVLPSRPDPSQDFQRRARLEAAMLAKLRHPNVVHVFDADCSEASGLVYIVMEKLEGVTLRSVLAAPRRLTVPEALSLGAQIADGVAAAHRSGAIHRDLKPENVFVERGNHVKVLDFGVAKFIGQGFVTTPQRTFRGTPLYMSPEQWRGGEITAQSDVYALGLVLYEALAGAHPYQQSSQARSMDEMAAFQLAYVPPALAALDLRVPDYVSRAIARAMDHWPSARFASMEAFGDALRRAERRYNHECQEAGVLPVLRDLVALSEPTADALSATSLASADTLRAALTPAPGERGPSNAAEAGSGPGGTLRLAPPDSPRPRPAASPAPGTESTWVSEQRRAERAPPVVNGDQTPAAFHMPPAGGQLAARPPDDETHGRSHLSRRTSLGLLIIALVGSVVLGTCLVQELGPASAARSRLRTGPVAAGRSLVVASLPSLRRASERNSIEVRKHTVSVEPSRAPAAPQRVPASHGSGSAP